MEGVEDVEAHEQLVRALQAAFAQPGGPGWAWPVPLPPGTPLECLRTHISTVLLAGGHALKLKRPVRLPFLDFSTPARREHFCREELRVNRRTAPALYLDVLPVRGSPAAPCFGDGGVGPAFDWAVWMRRFDSAGLYGRLAREGRLTEGHVDALAEAVARFQAAQPPSGPPWGDPADALRWARDNVAELQSLTRRAAGFAECGPALQGLAAWTDARHAQIAPLLQRRREGGAVIEGHGDLHLGNIVWHEGAPLLFDAIEFDPALRHADRYADLAFVFMDLHAHGMPAAAWRWLSGVLEHGGDHDGLPLLCWFAVYRALVRAKVALLSGGPAAASRAQALVALAQALARPAAPARLVLTCGLSGSGKSTVARALVEALGAVRVRSDVERKRLHGMAPTERPADPGRIYDRASTERTYARLTEVARAGLAGGVSVVVDAVFNRRAERDAMRRLAREFGADCVVVDCQAPEPVLRERLARRRAEGRDASDADASVLELQQRTREAPGPDEGPVCTLDTAVSIGEVLARARGVAERWQLAVAGSGACAAAPRTQ
jgi:hypothetical protein